MLVSPNFRNSAADTYNQIQSKGGEGYVRLSAVMAAASIADVWSIC